MFKTNKITIQTFQVKSLSSVARFPDFSILLLPVQRRRRSRLLSRSRDFPATLSFNRVMDQSEIFSQDNDLFQGVLCSSIRYYKGKKETCLRHDVQNYKNFSNFELLAPSGVNCNYFV